MTEVTITATFNTDIERVWEIITDLHHYQWRSDISRIEIVEEGKSFVEYTKKNFPTHFTITVFQPFTRYEFTMENDNMNGYWIGLLEEVPSGTTITFTEQITLKKQFMKPFAKIYLNKQQATYLRDLKNILEEKL